MTELTVYTKPKCVQCNATYKALDKKQHSYKSIDLTLDPTALDVMKSLGHMSAPVVLKHVDGVLVDSWSGFRPDKIEEL